MKKTSAIFCAILVLGMLCCRAQEPAAPAAGTGAEKPAASLAATAAESPMEVIMRLYRDAERQHGLLLDTYKDIHRRIQALAGIADNQNRLECALRLKRELDKFTARIELEKSKHITLKNRIDRYVAGDRLLKQETAYLDEYVDRLQLFGGELEKTTGNVTGAVKYLNRLVAALPPPPEYTIGDLGITMRLIVPKDRKFPAFYVSTAPLSVKQWQGIRQMNSASPLVLPPEAAAPSDIMGGITFRQALDAAAEITRIYGGMHSLPSTQEAACIARYASDLLPATAVWLRGKWQDDYQEKEAAQRFGIGLNILWDPRGVLYASPKKPDADEAFSGELAQASYRMLGMMLTSSVQTGKNNALQEAEAALDAEEKFTNGNTAE
ncbi:MAG: hypothetical protein J6S21_00305 [Victivallales bacterium]|nr:hypothetical protein [Victivallales bacterium]